MRHALSPDHRPDGGAEAGPRKPLPLLTAAIESAPTAMVMVDGAGAIVLVNRETEKLFGYAREELLGRPVEVLVPERFRAAHPGLRRGFFQTPEARRMGEGRDLFAVRKDGSEVPVEIGLNPVETGEETFVLSAIVDITERKRMEARFRATIDSAPTAMVMIDQTGAIVLVNRETEKLFGYARGELLGRPVEVLVPERFRGAHPGLRQGFFRTPEARRMGAGRDLFAVRKDGSEVPVEIGLNPVETGEGTFVLSAIVDITERKRMEEALRDMNLELERRVEERTAELARSNEALERSNLDLRRFAYVASHDLQSPLRSISGFVQLLQQEHQGKLGEQADFLIGRVVENTKRMQGLIQDLLSFSRVDSEARPLQPTDLGAVFDDAVAALEAPIRDTGAEVTRGDLPTVLGDRSQLVQLLQNLIDNAVKYHGDAAPRVHVSAEKQDTEWRISVEDHGIGIDPKQQERVFEIFHRLHTQRAYPGTGIGLAVLKLQLSCSVKQ